MRNILTIALKELRSYFVSPMAYVAIGFFVFIYGYFFVVSLNFMVRVSMQAGMMGGPQAININEYMVRPLLGNMAVVMLFLLPALTGRSYAEEKRSGTIELLLSSPLTGPQIILGKYSRRAGAVHAHARRHAHPRGGALPLRRAGARPDPERLPGAVADGSLVHLGGPADLQHDEEPDRRRRRRPSAPRSCSVDRQLDRRARRAAPRRPRCWRTSRSSTTSTISRRGSSTRSIWRTT